MQNLRKLRSVGSALLVAVLLLVYTQQIVGVLVHGFPIGGDSPSHLAKIAYLEQFWHDEWYYREGAGYPYLTLYSPLSYYLTLALKKATGFETYASFNLAVFASIFLSGLAAYFFLKKLTSSDLAAVAGSVMLTSSWGILAMPLTFAPFAQEIATPFHIAALAAFAHYLDQGRKPYFVLTVLMVSAAFLSHAAVGEATAISLVLYWLAVVLSGRASIRSIRALAGVAVASLLLSSFWLIPFSIDQASSAYPYTIRRELGLVDWIRFIVESFPSLLGAVNFSWFAVEYRPYLAANLLALVGLVYTTAISKKTNRKFWILLAIFCVALNLVAQQYVFLQGPEEHERLNPILRYQFSISLFIYAYSGLGVLAIRNISATLVRRKAYPTFPVLGKLQLEKIFSVLLVALVIIPSYNFAVNSIISDPGTGRLPTKPRDPREVISLPLSVVERIENNQFTRYEVGPRLGELRGIMPLLSEASEFGIYFGAGSLLRGLQGYGNAVLFESIGDSSELRAALQWFGIKYVLLAEDDPVGKYAQSGIELSAIGQIKEKKVLIASFKDAPSTISAGAFPSILVIGSQDNDAYTRFLSWVLASGVGPSRMITYNGGQSLEEIPTEELRRFDGVVLHGYTFKNNELAWKKLKEYVSEGGSLFIETGWQFVSQDWQSSNLQEPAPMAGTRWIDPGSAWNLFSTDYIELKEIDLSKFSPPIYEGTNWGMSAAVNLRRWAQPVLLHNGQTIIAAGTYGKGKVLWSGTQIAEHARIYGNQDEKRLFTQLLDWLLVKGETQASVKLERPRPNKVIVEVVSGIGKTVFFREAYHKNWNAWLETGAETVALKVYDAGPHFMAVVIPENITPPLRVVFEYRISTIEWFSYSVSASALTGLVLYMLPLRISLKTRIVSTFLRGVRKVVSGLKRRWEQD